MACGKQAGSEARQYADRYDGSKCQRISGGNTGNFTGEEARESKAGQETNQNAHGDKTEAI